MSALEDKRREHLLFGFLDKFEEMAYVIPTWYSTILAVKFSSIVKNESFIFFSAFPVFRKTRKCLDRRNSESQEISDSTRYGNKPQDFILLYPHSTYFLEYI